MSKKEATSMAIAIVLATSSTVTAVQTTRMVVNGFEIEVTKEEAAEIEQKTQEILNTYPAFVADSTETVTE